MRRLIIRAAIIPILLSLAGLHIRRKRRDRRPANDAGNESLAADTENRLVDGQVPGGRQDQSTPGQSTTPGTQPTPDRPVLDPPAGFKNKAEYEAFRDRLNQGLRDAGYGDARPILQGSGTDGYSHNPKKPPNTPFDARGHNTSDYDIAIASPSLMDAARRNGVDTRSRGTRTGPLTRSELRDLGLLGVQQDLKNMSGGRKVDFMVYQDGQFAVDRADGPSNSMAPPYGFVPKS